MKTGVEMTSALDAFMTAYPYFIVQQLVFIQKGGMPPIVRFSSKRLVVVDLAGAQPVAHGARHRLSGFHEIVSGRSFTVNSRAARIDDERRRRDVADGEARSGAAKLRTLGNRERGVPGGGHQVKDDRHSEIVARAMWIKPLQP